MTEQSHRVGILVDNPLRDLPGAVLLASAIAGRGSEAFLINLYDQFYDVFAIRPDVIIVNYARPNNKELLQFWSSLGIQICVLDTEGAPTKLNAFVNMLDALGISAFVDIYCTWGEVQRNLLIENQVLPADRIVATGSPRFDFVAPKYRAFLRGDKPGEDYILINTAFPYLHPRFNDDLDAERKGYKTVAGLSDSSMNNIYCKGQASYAGLIESVLKIATRFREKQFVVRPHPFEDIRAYESLNSMNNVTVIQSGTSLEWLANCEMLLHINCTTAIEARMLEKTPVSLAWLDFDETHVKLSSDVSLQANSFDELVSILETSSHFDSSCLPCIAEVERLFGRLDGDAANRSFDALVRGMPKKVQKTHGSIKLWAKVLVSLILGYQKVQKLALLKNGELHLNKREGKRFDCGDVERLLDSLTPFLDHEVKSAPIKVIKGASERLYSSNSVQVVSACG